jgi:hypothetical protein
VLSSAPVAEEIDMASIAKIKMAFINSPEHIIGIVPAKRFMVNFNSFL